MSEIRLKILFSAALIVVDTAWIVARGFSFDMTSLAATAGVTALMALIAIVYTRYRPDARLATMSTETGFLIVFSAAGCVFSYLVTTLDRPLIDNVLAKADTVLGFDWYSYVAFVNARPWLGVLSSFVYQTTLMQIALSVVILTLLGHIDRTREMTLLVMVSSFLCVLASGIVPSAGALAYYHPAASFYMQNHPVVDLAYKQQFFDLRAGLVTHLSLRDVHGLVAFPSYHAGLSVILILAFRGVKKWFWPVAVLNTLVIMSTPIDGGHHLSDGLGGVALAVGSALLVIWVRKKFSKAAAECASLDSYGGLAGQKA